MMELQRAVADVIRVDADVDNVASFIGADGTNPTLSSGRLSITLKTREQRKSSAQEIIDRLNAKLSQVGGITVYLQAVQDLQLASQVSRTQYQYTIEDADPDELAGLGAADPGAPQEDPRAGRRRQRSAGRRAADDAGHRPRHRLAHGDHRRRPSTTRSTTPSGSGRSRPSSPSSTSTASSWRSRPSTRRTPWPRTRSTCARPPASRCRSSAFVHFEHDADAVSIGHEGQFPSVTLSFNLAPRAALGDAVRAVNEAVAGMGAADRTARRLPGARRRRSATRSSSEPLLILAALITVYIVLGVLYESYIHPITILSTLPSAGVGAFLALMLCRSEFTVIALIGIVLLIGIVKKNAIMMIDFALEAEREEKKSPREAIHQACLLRFRPIMMTTVAALLGGLPLALGTGTGAELRRPLGITHRGRPAALAGPDALHHAGHLPLHGTSGGALSPWQEARAGACARGSPAAGRPLSTARRWLPGPRREQP